MSRAITKFPHGYGKRQNDLFAPGPQHLAQCLRWVERRSSRLFSLLFWLLLGWTAAGRLCRGLPNAMRRPVGVPHRHGIPPRS